MREFRCFLFFRENEITIMIIMYFMSFKRVGALMLYRTVTLDLRWQMKNL